MTNYFKIEAAALRLFRPGRLAAARPSRRAVLVTGGVTVAGLFSPAVVRGAEPETIRIGQIEPLTGSSAAYGIRGRNGAELSAETLNEAGIVIGGKTYKVALTVGDMANDARQSLTLLRQYASDDRIVCAIGPTNSVGYVPLIPVAAQLKMPLIGDGSGAPIKEWNSYSYRVNPRANA